MGKQVTELDALPSFTDTSLLPVHNGAGLKKGLLSQLASYLGTKFSSPNLLINPEFKINQRGLSSYSAGASRTYTVDRWGGTQFTATVDSNAITIQANKSGVALFSQKLEKATEAGFTVSVHVVSVTGTAKLKTTGIEGTLKAGWNYFTSASSTSEITLEIAQGGSLKIDKIKLEQGSVATSFVAPNLAEELVKCKRFYQTTVGYPETDKLRNACIPVYAMNTGSNFRYYFEIEMRIAPTTTFGNSTTLNEVYGGKSIAITKKEASVIKSRGLQVQLAHGSNATASKYCYLDAQFDAEIY